MVDKKQVLRSTVEDDEVEETVEEETKEVNTKPVKEGDVMAILQKMVGSIEKVSEDVAGLSKKVREIENGGVNKFQDFQKAEDITSASETRAGLDPKIAKIVDEMLGADFGAEVKPMGDTPGFLFTLIVPKRLSDNVVDKRPVKATDENGNYTGQYQKDTAGNVVMEDYYQEDRRSKVISSTDSYDAIKTHCERVRGYIVSYYQKMSKPLPEFKVR